MYIQSIITALILILTSSVVFAEDGVAENLITFGQTAALTGNTANLGIGLQNGMLAAFHEVNESGGINGKLIKLITLDDEYEPNIALANVKKLIETDKVFAMIGTAGTTISNAILPFATNLHIPLLGTYSGAEFLRTQGLQYVVNVRASYSQETEGCVSHLVETMQKKRIGVLFQDDTFGRSGLAGVTKALSKRNLNLVAAASYVRNTTAVKAAALKLQEAQPDAVVIIGVAQPAAEFIKVAKDLGMDCKFATLSVVGTELISLLGPQGEGVIISQVMPSPFNNVIPLVAQYQKAIKAYNQNLDYDYISFEGFVIGKFNTIVLKNMVGEITRENYINTIIEMKDFDLQGIKLHYSKNDNQGMTSVFMTIINNKGGLDSIESKANAN